MIFQAQEVVWNDFGARLVEEDGKGNLFRLAKQMVRTNMDVADGTCVKDKEGIVVEDSQVKEVWREYFEKLLNEEFDWNRATLSLEEASVDQVN